jgi:hypothetical protein
MAIPKTGNDKEEPLAKIFPSPANQTLRLFGLSPNIAFADFDRFGRALFQREWCKSSWLSTLSQGVVTLPVLDCACVHIFIRAGNRSCSRIISCHEDQIC